MQQPNKPCKGVGNYAADRWDNAGGTADFRPRLCLHGGNPPPPSPEILDQHDVVVESIVPGKENGLPVGRDG